MGPASITTFVPKNRALSSSEIRVMLKQLDHIATLPTIRLGMRLYLLTVVRKSELQNAYGTRSTSRMRSGRSPERIKRSKANNACRARYDIMIALKTCVTEFKISAAVVASRGCSDVARHLEPGDLRSRRTGESGRFATGAVYPRSGKGTCR